MRHWIEINRAPVLTLWAAVVATRLGFEWEEALTLGRAVAGLNAYSKGKALGLFEPRRPGAGAEPELFPEMSRRQAVSESEPMQPARQKFVTQGRHLHRPTLGEKCRETRLHFDRGTGVSAHP